MGTQATTLTGGSFYGAVQARQQSCGAIFTDLMHRTARKLPSHSHELPFFAVILGGDYAECYERQQNYFRPFTVSFRPAGIPHQDEIGPQGVRFFEIEIRREWQTRLHEATAKLDTAYDDHAGGKLLWLAMRLFRESRTPLPENDLSIETLLAELLAAVSLPAQRIKDPPSWLLRVVAKINDEFCQRLTLDELSAEAGVHPVHLSRTFRKCNGEGIGEYVHGLRIRAACEQLLDPELSLAQISYDTGFSDQSHFTRVFGRLMGMSPAKFRQTLSPNHNGESGNRRLTAAPLAHTSADTAVPGNPLAGESADYHLVARSRAPSSH